MNADRSASARTRHVRARALAGFHVGNPNTPEGGRSKTGMGAEALVARISGQVAYTTVNLGLPNTVESGCDCTIEATAGPAPEPCTPGTITNFLGGVPDFPFIFPNGGDGSVENPYYFNVSWDPLSGAISYTVTSTFPDGSIPTPPDLIESTGVTSARITTYFNDDSNVERTFSVSAQTACGPTSTTLEVAPCFLAGALVTLANGSTVPIENVRVGDVVLGAFGESNTVLALHRPLLGANTMTAINGEHHTSSHHPHVSADKKFYSVKPAIVEEYAYRQYHEVLDNEGVRRMEFLYGLNVGRVQPLTLGLSLKTVEGSRPVVTLDTYDMSMDTQLYNLVVSGSHTYHVDGYAVTGWPREDDFNYDTWTPRILP
jgi:hypothetical protein